MTFEDPTKKPGETGGLGEEFYRTLSKVEGMREEKIIPLFLELCEKYQEKHRHYHTLTHIKSLHEILQERSGDIKNRIVVLLTMWFHDAIYDTGQFDNEEQSALYATEKLTELGVLDDIIQRVAFYILATANHEASSDLSGEEKDDLEIFLDSDMSILGAPPEEYLDYAISVRKEYGQYSIDDYRRGRIDFLEGTLKKPKIFITKFATQKYETQARENIRWEIEALKSGKIS